MSTRFLALVVSVTSMTPLALDAGIRSMAYYAAWNQWGHMPASEVDFSAVTHVIHFAVVPNSDGTLDSGINGVTPEHSADAVAGAHAAGTKVLISVGGAGSAPGFRSACAPQNLSSFIQNTVSFMDSRGYDGVDLDWEPLDAADAALYTNLVNGLRAALDGITPRPLLTAAVATEPALLAGLQHHFDQIHLMTYDLAGPWPGWVTWFNAPIKDGGYRFPSNGALVPSAEGMLNTFLAAGVDARKLAIGIDFYGRVWSGGTGTSTGGAALPRQSWSTAPSMTYQAYHQIMTDFHEPQRHFWDQVAQAAYLSIDMPGSADDKFITYDDPTACRAKVWYSSQRGLGGVMLFELGGGYRPDQPDGQREPLLQAVKQAVRETFVIHEIRQSEADIVISFSSAIGQEYRL
ncbi:MAG TPA: glycoside hydrolase family 18 protein, partial [Luteolibacter sp.]|nr:glycoside hydrolase family 18 protein [Luteolibacter sp.]